MGHDKLRKFAENETFACLVQPQTRQLLAEGYENLGSHPLKGHWSDFFADTLGFRRVGGAADDSCTVNEGSGDKSGAVGGASGHYGSYSASGDNPGAGDTGQYASCRLGSKAVADDFGEDCRLDACKFVETAPLVLELGCGKGEYTVDLARRYPGKCFIGVDIKGARLWKGAKYATETSMPNVAFLRSRIEFIGAFFGPGEVSEIWLTFSDPQIRKENLRLTSPIFLERYRRMLRPGGIVHLKTDSRFLYEYTLAVCRANGFEVLTSTTDLYSGTFEGKEPAPEVTAVQTFYESIFREQGYKITYLAFRIDGNSPIDSPSDFDSDYWRSVEGPRQLFGRDTAETRRQKLQSAK